MTSSIERHKLSQVLQVMSIIVEPIYGILQPQAVNLKSELIDYEKKLEILELELMSECSKHIENGNPQILIGIESNKPMEKSFQMKFDRLNDKLAGLRREK